MFGLKSCRKLLLLLLLITGSLFATDHHPTGTLIVTYHTGAKGERLDRVRFWIKEGKNQHMYPKGSAYVDDPESMTRVVVIEDLPPGNYKLEFLIPNTDNLFEEVPARTFRVTPRNIVKIDQMIKPQYGSLKVSTEPYHKQRPFKKNPTITLHDQYGRVSAQSTVGKLRADELPPGEYTITFEELEGYDSPNPISFILEPHEEKESIVYVYQPARRRRERLSQYAAHHEAQDNLYLGPGVIDTKSPIAIDDTVEVEDLTGGVHALVKLPPNRGGDQTYPKISVIDDHGETAASSSNGSLIVEDLQPGDYTLIFGDLQGCVAPDEESLSIEAGEMLGPINGEYILPTGKLVVRFESHTEETPLDEICFSLKDDEGNCTLYPQAGRVIQDPLTGGKLVVIQCLPAGEYCLEFLSENDNAKPIAIHEVEIRPNRTQTIHQVFEEGQNLDARAPLPREAGDDQKKTDELADKTIIINYPEWGAYEEHAFITIDCNLPDGRWALYDNNCKVTSGSGLSSHLQVSADKNFLVKPEQIPDHSVTVTPLEPFELGVHDRMKVKIVYEPIEESADDDGE